MRGWLSRSSTLLVLLGTLVGGCASTALISQPNRAENCSSSTQLVACAPEQVEAAIDVEDLRNRAKVGDAVVVRGRAVLGGVCCRCASCFAATALGVAGSGDVVSADGPLAFLTHWQSAKHSRIAQPQTFPGLTRACRFSSDATYCCDSDAMGGEVVVWADVIASPAVSTGAAETVACDESMAIDLAGRSPACRYRVPWRKRLESISALAVKRACKIVE